MSSFSSRCFSRKCRIDKLARPQKDYYWKRAILCLQSSKILTPHPPLRLASVSPPQQRRGYTHTRRAERGVGGQYFGRRATQDCPLTVITSLRPRPWTIRRICFSPTPAHSPLQLIQPECPATKPLFYSVFSLCSSVREGFAGAKSKMGLPFYALSTSTQFLQEQGVSPVSQVYFYQSFLSYSFVCFY